MFGHGGLYAGRGSQLFQEKGSRYYRWEGRRDQESGQFTYLALLALSTSLTCWCAPPWCESCCSWTCPRSAPGRCWCRPRGASLSASTPRRTRGLARGRTASSPARKRIEVVRFVWLLLVVVVVVVNVVAAAALLHISADLSSNKASASRQKYTAQPRHPAQSLRGNSNLSANNNTQEGPGCQTHPPHRSTNRRHIAHGDAKTASRRQSSTSTQDTRRPREGRQTANGQVMLYCARVYARVYEPC